MALARYSTEAQDDVVQSRCLKYPFSYIFDFIALANESISEILGKMQIVIWVPQSGICFCGESVVLRKVAHTLDPLSMKWTLRPFTKGREHEKGGKRWKESKKIMKIHAVANLTTRGLVHKHRHVCLPAKSDTVCLSICLGVPLSRYIYIYSHREVSHDRYPPPSHRPVPSAVHVYMQDNV